MCIRPNVHKCKKILTWWREVSKKCYRRYYCKRLETINKSLIDETASKRTNVQHFNDLSRRRIILQEGFWNRLILHWHYLCCVIREISLLKFFKKGPNIGEKNEKAPLASMTEWTKTLSQIISKTPDSNSKYSKYYSRSLNI